MKSNRKNHTMPLSQLLFFSLLFSILFGSAAKSYAKESLTLQNSSRTLTVGASAKFTIRNLSNSSFVFFFSSDEKIAAIERTSGKITAKKKGTVTISAQIYKQNQKIKTLKTKLSVQSKDYIENAVFSLKKTINPYDYTIKLKSSRIILKKEIKKSRLSITPEGKKSPKLSASFSGLSKDGKEVIYLLNASSRKKLCPHDSSMNGTYIIQSNSFEKKIKAKYKERMDTDDISGFVLDIDGTPLSNTFISYQTTEGTASSYTDEAGHYEVKETGTPVSLSAEKEGYQTENLTSLLLSNKGTVCENFILKPDTEQNLTLDFFIKDENGAPVSDAQISLFPKIAKNAEGDIPEKNLSKTFSPLVSADTGEDGTLLLTNAGNNENALAPYTKITAENNISLSLLSGHEPSSSKICSLPETLNNTKEYTLYICKKSKAESPSYEPCSLTFSPSAFYTGKLFFEITLKKNKFLDTSGLMIDLESPEYSDKISTLSFSFYEPGEKNPVYEISSTPILMFSTSEIPVSFSDGIYFLKISALDKTNEILYFSPVTEIQVKNSQILPVKIKLQKKSYARLLAYFSGDHFPETSNKKVSFDLYQKTGNHYFYLTTVSSSDFKQTISDLYTADFSLSCLLPSQTYLFLPELKPLRPSTFFTAEVSSDHLYPAEVFALLSPPFAKCSCICQTIPSGVEISVPEDFFAEPTSLTASTSLTISKEQVRTEPSYLNSVVVLYKKDGTFISTTLSTKLDKNTVFSKKSDMIIDIYTNHELLLTNQSSYR